MAITSAIVNSYKQEILEGVHDSADTYKIALYTDAANLDKTTTTYVTTAEVSGAGYTAGGATLQGFVTGISGDTAYIDWTTDPSWSNATISARGAMVYNSSKSNKTVAVYDFGSVVSSTNGTFTLVLPAAGLQAIVRVS